MKKCEYHLELVTLRHGKSLLIHSKLAIEFYSILPKKPLSSGRVLGLVGKLWRSWKRQWSAVTTNRRVEWQLDGRNDDGVEVTNRQIWLPTCIGSWSNCQMPSLRANVQQQCWGMQLILNGCGIQLQSSRKLRNSCISSSNYLTIRDKISVENWRWKNNLQSVHSDISVYYTGLVVCLKTRKI